MVTETESLLLKDKVVKIFDESHGRGGSLEVFGELEKILSVENLDTPQIVGLLQAVYFSGKRASSRAC